MANLLNSLSVEGLSNMGTSSPGELIQQLALLNWLKKQDDSSKQTLTQITTLRVVSSLYNEITNQDKIDAARAETILRISEYVKKNPKASKADLSQYISSEIVKFSQLVESL